MAAQEIVPSSSDDPDLLAFGGFAVVGVTGMRLIRRRKRVKPVRPSKRRGGNRNALPEQPLPTEPALTSVSSIDAQADNARTKQELSAKSQCFVEMGASPDLQPFETSGRKPVVKHDSQPATSDSSSKWTHYAGTAWLVFGLLLGAFFGLRGSADAVVQPQAVHQQRAIDHIRVGQRVLTAAPEGISLEADPQNATVAAEPEETRELRIGKHFGATAVDPATWRLVRMRADQTWDDGTIDDINVETLQPLSWLKEFGIQPGRQAPIPLDLVEMGMEEDLTATVLEILPCPEIESGPGKVVLTTVDHLNRDVLELKVRKHDGCVDTVRTTGGHKFYSQTYEAWVSASELVSGELLHGMHGSITVVSSQRVSGTHRVYNMTVEDEHVYRVAGHGILVHNNDCLHGPYYRSELPLNAINNAHAGTLWGNPPKYGGSHSPFPKAQAKSGPLPEGVNGLAAR